MDIPSGDYSTRASAAAGHSRTARQPPSDPAIRPPAIASTTARATAPNVTGAVRWTETVWAAGEAARANRPPGPPDPLAVLAVLAVSGGASALISAAAP